MTRYIALVSLAALGWALTSPAGACAQAGRPVPANPALKGSGVSGAAELMWGADLSTALEQAAKSKQLVFIDFTGVTCTNCKINEKSVFTKPEVKEMLAQYARVQLYTDEVPAEFYKDKVADDKREADADANHKFQKEQFQTEQLPLYVIVRPGKDGTFEKVATYNEGRIHKVDAFVAFLKKPLAGAKE